MVGALLADSLNGDVVVLLNLLIAAEHRVVDRVAVFLLGGDVEREPSAGAGVGAGEDADVVASEVFDFELACLGRYFGRLYIGDVSWFVGLSAGKRACGHTK